MAVSDLHPSPNQPLSARPVPAWLWPHVLSLEAPAVAALWALALGRLHGVPWLPGVLPGLALCVWTIYLADRTLDTYAVEVEQLDARHRVYRRFRPFLLGLALPACVAGLVWLGLWVVPAGLMWQCVALAMLVVIYLATYAAAERRLLYLSLVGTVCLVAVLLVMAMPMPGVFKVGISIIVVGLLSLLMRQGIRRRLLVTVPKEIAGGLLFALGCTAWVRYVGTGADHLGGGLETALLTALFTCNLTGITTKEAEAQRPQAAAENGHYGLLAGLGILSLGAIIAVHGLYLSERLEPLAWATAGGAVLLALLHARRRALSVEAYRVLADIAVAVPALVLFWSLATGSRAADCCLP